MTIAASTDLVLIRRALISVSDKSGLPALAKTLFSRGIEIISTGGTASTLRSEGIEVRDVSELTDFPEMMDGRVKTLHPAIHGGLLALRDNFEHLAAMEQAKIAPIDLLIVNLYPFEETVSKGSDYNTCVENIDIGGPAMIRAAAKNHRFVTVLTDPADYSGLLREMATHSGAATSDFRRKMALEAYARTAAYDAAVSGWLASQTDNKTPRHINFAGRLSQKLRYGENPHQMAAFYDDGSSRQGVATAHQWQGKELSYNNINDTNAAYELVSEFTSTDGPVCVIIKHANPCGVAKAETLSEAYQKALACDRISAFGGIIAFNQPLDAKTAEDIIETFTEVVIAPGASDEAKQIFSTKQNLRLLTTESLAEPHASRLFFKQVSGGILVQDQDNGFISAKDLKQVSKRAPTKEELKDLLFAWKVAKHVKSNAIIYAKNQTTVGIGAGQMSRIDSTRIAARKAEDMQADPDNAKQPTIGSVVASDAFFPFPDGLLAAAEAGAKAVIQPGGSLNDDKVIAAADEAGLAMVFTGMRHFRH